MTLPIPHVQHDRDLYYAIGVYVKDGKRKRTEAAVLHAQMIVELARNTSITELSLQWQDLPTDYDPFNNDLRRPARATTLDCYVSPVDHMQALLAPSSILVRTRLLHDATR